MLTHILLLLAAAAATRTRPERRRAAQQQQQQQHQQWTPQQQQQSPPARPAAAGAVDIGTLVNVSQAADHDISAVLDGIAVQNPAGRTVLFPGPASFLLSPAGRSNWTLPAALVLQMEGGAILKAAPLLQVYMGGEVLAAPGQRIFAVGAAPVTLRPNTTSGGRLTTVIATTAIPHNFQPGSRFRLADTSDHCYHGGWGATTVLSPTQFSFEVAHPPASNDSITAALSVASFMFDGGTNNAGQDTDARPGGWRATGPVAWAYPEMWGAVGAGQLGNSDQPPPSGVGHDSTAAVQFAFDSGAPVLFLQDYAVSRVTLCGGNRMLDGQNHWLIGNQLPAGVTTNAVFEIKCGSSIIRDVWIMGAFNESYECGAQWYTNDLNLWQPEFNRIEGMQFWWLNIGLAVGVLPSQSHCCGWQGVVVPDGQATNAPLSESSMTGLEFVGVVCAIHFHQPNGYLQLADSTILSTALGWPSNTFPYNASVALFMGGGSLNVVNCDLENQAGEGWRDPGARVVRMLGGELSLKNIIYEAMSSFHISGGSVIWNGGLDDGLNGEIGVSGCEKRPSRANFDTYFDGVFEKLYKSKESTLFILSFSTFSLVACLFTKTGSGQT